MRARRIVSRGDAGDVRAVKAVGQRTWRRGARSDLLIRSIWTHRLRDARLRGRVTGLGHDLPREKRMRTVNAGVEDRDRLAGAVVAAGPNLIRLNQRHALGEQRFVNRVFHHAHDVAAERIERVESRARDVERDERKTLEFTERTRAGRKQAQHARGILAPRKLHDHADAAGAQRALTKVLWNVLSAGNRLRWTGDARQKKKEPGYRRDQG